MPSQQVKVGRTIDFQGVAAYSPNMNGNPFPLRSCFDEDFFADFSEHDWVAEVTNIGAGGTIAWAAPHTVVMTTDANDNDCAEFSHASTWSGAKNAMLQARIKMNAITTIGVNVGLVDADMSTDNQVCFEITSGAATLVNARVSNGAAFVFDTDGSADYWYMCATKGDAEGTPVVVALNGSSVAPVANTYAYFGLKVDTSGNVTYYYNFNPVGFQASALTAATSLIPYVSLINRTTAARIVTIDRITLWQDAL